MKTCRNCLLPDNFPNSKITDDGLCVYCRKNKKHASYAHEEPHFLELVKEAKARGNKYDCLVCYSGGKDSTYTLIQVKEKYGMNPLAFTLDNGFISPQAKENIALMCEKIGVDLITVRPDQDEMDAVFKSSLLKKIFPDNVMNRLSAACYVCISYVNWEAIKLSLENDLSLIVSGFTHGQIPKAVFPHNPSFLEKTYNGMKSALNKYVDFDVNKFYPAPDLSKINDDFPLYNVNPLLFDHYDEKQIIAAIKEWGWERPTDVDSCSSNCLMNAVGNHFHAKLYGYHPYQYEISALRRNGAITKEEAVEMLQESELEPQSLEIIKQLKIEEY